MANSNGWGDGSVNNNIGWGQGANNAIGWGKSHINSWSGLTDIDGLTSVVNTVAPAITGTAQEGQTVTCSTGTWTGTPTITFAYQWKRNGSNIGSATNSTYTLVTADVSQSITCQVTATNGVGSANANSNTITPIAALDPDAQAFITAAAITDPTQQAAINTLVVDLKGYSIWTKMKALYPFVGGTASQHKFNLKDPRDLDVAFRLVFNGGWTHSSTGATPNGTNAYADTFLNPSTSLTTASAHFSKYNRTNDLVGNKVDGIFDANNNSFFQQNYVSANGIIGEIGSIATYTQTDSRGLFTMSRTATNVFKVFKNSSSVATNTTTITNIPNFNFFIGVRNDGSTGGKAFYNSYQCAFASLGDGLTDTEATNFYTAVQAFQTTLNRQIP